MSTFALPQTQARDQALLFCLALTIVTIGVFGWMYVAWLRPLRRLVRAVDRIADGDLGTPVEIRRYDEIGLVARAVERIRARMVRDLTPRADHAHPMRPQPPEFYQ